MDIVKDIWTFIITHYAILFTIGFVAWNYKALYESLFLQPIRGGNGVTAPDELAKYVLIVLTIMEWAKPTRDAIILGELLTATITIAGLQRHYSSNHKKHTTNATPAGPQ